MQNEKLSKRKRLKFMYQNGDKFGRLTLTGLTYTKSLYGHWVRYVEAVCQCGEVKEYAFHLLLSGDTQSCGCYRKEVTRKRTTTHNLSKHPLYIVRQEMMARCYNETNPAFNNYGGRGIEIWKDWKDDFLEFYDWAMNNGYKEGLSIDRIDNDGNYAPYNCRFSDRPEQNRNKRNNRNFTAFGETKCLFDWGKDKRCKVTVWGLRSRVDKGWDFEEALTTELADRKEVAQTKKGNVYITAFGEKKCLTAWLEDKRCVVKLDALRDRLKKGWSGEKILTKPPQASGKKRILNI